MKNDSVVESSACLCAVKLVVMNECSSLSMLLCLCEGVGSAMNQCEDREEGVPPSKTTLCGEHDSQTKAQR